MNALPITRQGATRAQIRGYCIFPEKGIFQSWEADCGEQASNGREMSGPSSPRPESHQSQTPGWPGRLHRVVRRPRNAAERSGQWKDALLHLAGAEGDEQKQHVRKGVRGDRPP
jgi:hypothetical protein